MEKNLRNRINNKSKIHVISNWVDINHFTYISRIENPLFNKYSIDKSKFIFLYAGSLGEAQNIDLIIESAEKSKHLDNVLFLIFGFGNKVNEFSSLVLEKKMANILIFPAEPYENANLVYSMADVGLVTCKKGFGQTSLPSKTMSILSTGCPILASFDNNTELEEIIINYKLGVFTSADDSDSFIKSIELLYNNRLLVQQFKGNTRNFAVENFSPDIQIEKYIRIFEDLRR
jgi:colanic acid biosynthesis glycosyl transferase WcaI